jgi:hypothetical protein
MNVTDAAFTSGRPVRVPTRQLPFYICRLSPDRKGYKRRLKTRTSPAALMVRGYFRLERPMERACRNDRVRKTSRRPEEEEKESVAI